MLNKSSNDITIPFLKQSFIEEKANLFREKYWNNSIPVDIERIIEIELKLNIIPIPDSHYLKIDTLITSDWKSIYVDEKEYMDERFRKRLRFSLAHEIGHMILHEDIYQGFKINDFSDFYSFFNNISKEQYGYLEKQADIFANYLLVPRGKLSEEYDEIKKSHKKEFSNIDETTLNQYISIPLSKKFEVSEAVIEIALKH
jgi:Zn-dependent peptidase ImmA (M78 family)